jgi:hypothetical protein
MILYIREELLATRRVLEISAWRDGFAWRIGCCECTLKGGGEYGTMHGSGQVQVIAPTWRGRRMTCTQDVRGAKPHGHQFTNL